jgi:hypothetical protein
MFVRAAVASVQTSARVFQGATESHENVSSVVRNSIRYQRKSKGAGASSVQGRAIVKRSGFRALRGNAKDAARNFSRMWEKLRAVRVFIVAETARSQRMALVARPNIAEFLDTEDAPANAPPKELSPHKI